MAYSSRRSSSMSPSPNSQWQRRPPPPKLTPTTPNPGADDDSYNFVEGSNYSHRRKQDSGNTCSVSTWFKSCFAPETVDHGPPTDPRRPQHQQEVYNDDVSMSSVSSRASKASTSKWRVQIYKQQQGDGRGGGATEFRLSYLDIATATRNFSPKNEIGHGGFGVVYRGILRDGTQVAVKRGAKSGKDRQLSTEFRSEIEALSSVEHLNLVSFFGYIENQNEWIVVVEYVTNGNLREHLDGKRGKGLEVAARLDIATDVAHAISYLHMYADHSIIHRDIKPSNILLTENLRAKVTDFGFARFISDDARTHISTQVKGTFGYIDPEYVNTNQLTQKSDVYSFGVVLVELITGRRPIEKQRGIQERVTIRWALKKLQQGDVLLAMDPRLMKTPASIVAAENVLELASKCLLAARRELRPSMAECAQTLWAIRKTYRENEESGFLDPPLSASPSSRRDFNDHNKPIVSAR